MHTFDIHTHVGRLLVDLPYNRPEDLIAFLDLHHIDMAAVMAVENSGEVDFYVTSEQVLEACALFPERLVPFCNIDPRHRYPETFNPRPIIAEYAQRGCKGFGEVLADVPFDYPGLQAIYAACADFDLPVLFHSDHYLCYDEPGEPRLENMLRTFPQTTFIGHALHFWAEISAGATAQDYRFAHYAEGVVIPGGATDRMLGQYPNLYGDLSANSGFNALTRDPAFGFDFLSRHQDKLVLGTDCIKPGHPAPIINFIRTAPITEEAREKIMWKNAARLLKLEGF
jgi:uncharacterized protein